MSPRLSKLVSEGLIGPVAVRLGPRDMPNRQLLWTRAFESWSRGACLSDLRSSSATIAEQLNTAFADFVSGRPLTSGLARCDPPKGEGLWRLKTPDLRLYGWADDVQCMVLAVGEFVSVVKAPGPPRDRDLGRATVSERRRLQLGFKYGERFDIFPTAR